MRDLDPSSEAAFFDLMKECLNLERTPTCRYAEGEYALGRMAPLAALAGNPERDLRIIHVAGTKGKGSTCQWITQLLLAAGTRSGQFTSPHLATVRERFQINGELVSYDVLLDSTREWISRCRQAGPAPTFFEALTLLALRLFRDAGCDTVVLETGIGGRLDATNYIATPACTVITPVSYDHIELLGETIGQIASEKAGILKAGVPVVLAHQPYPAAGAAVRARATALGCPCIEPASAQQAAPYQPPALPPVQRENLRAALAAVRCVAPLPSPAPLARPVLRARCETISENPLVVLDGAHNEDSARRLSEALAALHADRQFVVILGISPGKDAGGILRQLKRPAREFVLTNPRSPRGSGLDELQRCARDADMPVTVIPDIQSRSQLPPGNAYLFTGSFFTAAIGEDLFQA